MAQKILVIGGGAAGFFGAIKAATTNPYTEVVITEAGLQCLRKVRISGGGRCNVTHACFDPRLLVQNYPRGAKELQGVFARFQPRDTIAWFTDHGVPLKIEGDGRIFPESDSSASIIECLQGEASRRNVQIRLQSAVTQIKPSTVGFSITFAPGQSETYRAVLIATGSSPAGHALAKSLGHSITPLAPSLFTFKVNDASLTELSGLSLESVGAQITIGGKKFSAHGPLLITHWGLSGPAVLRLSAFAAPEFLEAKYCGTLLVNTLPNQTRESFAHWLEVNRGATAKKLVRNLAPEALPQRFWHYCLQRAGIPEVRVWSGLSSSEAAKLTELCFALPFSLTGKGEFKEEFVTCGGVKRSELDWKTMQSRLVPGLFFAGEVVDVDGVTGGFNFQNAWSGSWLAGQAMAQLIADTSG